MIICLTHREVDGGASGCKSGESVGGLFCKIGFGV